MDVLLKDGDLRCDCRGLPVTATDEEAFWQRAMVRLAVRRGSLPHAPDFGSRLYRIAVANPQRREQEALFAVREALAPMKEIEVRGVRCAWNPAAARLTVQVQLQNARGTKELEVTV